MQIDLDDVAVNVPDGRREERLHLRWRRKGSPTKSRTGLSVALISEEAPFDASAIESIGRYDVSFYRVEV